MTSRNRTAFAPLGEEHHIDNSIWHASRGIMTPRWAIVVRANDRQPNTPRLLYATLGATDCIGHEVI
jgi:hypothetical protein